MMHADTMVIIRTDRFNIGVMGRSGSRSIINDIYGRSVDHVKIMSDIENFNNKEILKKQTNNLKDFVHNVLVLRDPKERARSGIRVELPANFHGAPFLHKIDIEAVTHIIKFEDFRKYFTIHLGKIGLPTGKCQWDLNDYSDDDWAEEYRLYKILLQKPILKPFEYTIMKGQIEYINCKGIPGKRYKTWDS